MCFFDLLSDLAPQQSSSELQSPGTIMAETSTTTIDISLTRSIPHYSLELPSVCPVPLVPVSLDASRDVEPTALPSDVSYDRLTLQTGTLNVSREASSASPCVTVQPSPGVVRQPENFRTTNIFAEV